MMKGRLSPNPLNGNGPKYCDTCKNMGHQCATIVNTKSWKPKETKTTLKQAAITEIIDISGKNVQEVVEASQSQTVDIR